MCAHDADYHNSATTNHHYNDGAEYHEHYAVLNHDDHDNYNDYYYYDYNQYHAANDATVCYVVVNDPRLDEDMSES